MKCVLSPAHAAPAAVRRMGGDLILLRRAVHAPCFPHAMRGSCSEPAKAENSSVYYTQTMRQVKELTGERRKFSKF